MRRSDGYNKKGCVRKAKRARCGGVVRPRSHAEAATWLIFWHGLSDRSGLVAARLRCPRERSVRGKELAVLVLVEPGAFYVECLDGGEAGEGERADRPGIWLVVQNVNCAVPDLKKIDVASNRAFGIRGQKPDAVFFRARRYRPARATRDPA
jgi:hypothetical protein